MLRPVVFADANVLYSSTLRGWLFNLSEAGAFTLMTTEDVIAEAVSHWRNNNPTAPGGVTTRMSENIRTLSSVIREYDCELPFPGSDEGDIHVHAACVAGEVEYLVTGDKGFLNMDDAVKDGLKYEIYDIDEFLVLVHNQSPMRIRDFTRAAISRQVELKNKPRVADALRLAGAPKFAFLVNEHARNLAGDRRAVYAQQPGS